MKWSMNSLITISSQVWTSKNLSEKFPKNVLCSSPFFTVHQWSMSSEKQSDCVISLIKIFQVYTWTSKSVKIQSFLNCLIKPSWEAHCLALQPFTTPCVLLHSFVIQNFFHPMREIHVLLSVQLHIANHPKSNPVPDTWSFIWPKYASSLMLPWRRKWQSTPGFLPGESHGQRSLLGYSPRGCKELDMTEQITHLMLPKLLLPSPGGPGIAHVPSLCVLITHHILTHAFVPKYWTVYFLSCFLN